VNGDGLHRTNFSFHEWSSFSEGWRFWPGPLELELGRFLRRYHFAVVTPFCLQHFCYFIDEQLEILWKMLHYALSENYYPCLFTPNQSWGSSLAWSKSRHLRGWVPTIRSPSSRSVSIRCGVYQFCPLSYHIICPSMAFFFLCTGWYGVGYWCIEGIHPLWFLL